MAEDAGSGDPRQPWTFGRLGHVSAAIDREALDERVASRGVQPIYFATPAEWRAWLEANHATETEVWVGMYKAHTGRNGLTWALAVREALCFGWIDGIMRRVDEDRHMQRFTPRKKTSKWSAVNVALVAELEAAGLMTDAGRRAFEARNKDEVPYSTSDRPDTLPEEYDAVLRRDAAAAAFWDACPPSYRKTLSFWVTSAKRPETRDKRLAELIADCAAGRRMPRFSR